MAAVSRSSLDSKYRYTLPLASWAASAISLTVTSL